MEQQNQISNQLYSVLVLAEEIALARQIFLTLHAAGFDCHYAPDGMTGIETVVEKQPHLILLDSALPDFDSHLMCLAIRRLSRVPILLMSDAKNHMLLPAIEAGADSILFKPCQPFVWMAHVEAQLRRVYQYDADSHRQNLSHYPTLGDVMKRITHRRPARLPQTDKPCHTCGRIPRPGTLLNTTLSQSLCESCINDSRLAVAA